MSSLCTIFTTVRKAENLVQFLLKHATLIARIV